MTKAWIVLWFVFLHLHSFGQDFSQFHYTSENGLPENRVICMTEDIRGFMWFGTTDGLSRFDGVNFKNYFTRASDSVASLHWLNNLLEIKPGHLAMSVSGCRLVMLNTYTGQFYKAPEFQNRTICEMRKISTKRFVLFGTDTSFVVDENLKIVDAIVPELNGKHGKTFAYPLEKDLFLVGLSWDPSTYSIYNLRTKSFKRFDMGLKNTEADQLQFNFYDSTNNWLYFANYFIGIHRYSLDGVRLKSWPVTGYGWALGFNDSTLIVGSDNQHGGLFLNTHTGQTKVITLGNSRTFDLFSYYTDRQGNKWICTSRGVRRLTADNPLIKTWQTFEGQPNGTTYPVNILRGADHNLYLSFFTIPWLYRFNAKTRSWNLIHKNLATGPWCINPAGNDIIFTGGGTMRFTTFSPRSGTFQTSTDFLKPYFPNADVLILAFQHSNGDRWYSANKGGGFVRVAADDGKIHHYTKNNQQGRMSFSYYNSFAEDGSGNLWFGVNKTGLLLHWNLKKDQFSEVLLDTIPGITAKLTEVINQIICDKQNNLWIASDGWGVVKYDHVNNRAKQFAVDDGLPSRYISSMAFDNKNRLWLSSYNKGISCLYVDENRVQTFTRQDRLTEHMFVERALFYDSADNKMWVGAPSTVMCFDPDLLLAQQRPLLNLYVDEIHVNGKYYPREPDEKPDLPYHYNNLQFSFVAINMDRKSIELAYKLEGYDTAWINSLSGTVASYANLPPGNYSFMVKGNYTGDAGLASFSKAFIFHIATPWFQTWWFRISSATAAIFVMMMLIRSYYSRKAEKQRLTLEKQQAIEKERTRIATDMHDDFGASISRIKFISEKIKIKTQADDQLNQDLTKISAYSDQMSERMNEIVWALNERYDSLEDLVSFSRAYAAEYLSHHEIQFNFIPQILTNKKLNGEIRRNLFLVIKEALHNIVKHADASRVEIVFEQEDNLRIIIRDNGKSFIPEEVRPFANGISNMRKRINDIGGKFEIINDHGTTISIEVAV